MCGSGGKQEYFQTFSAVAANTPCSDGKRVFAFYSSNDLAALDLDGNLLWYRGLASDYPEAGKEQSHTYLVADRVATLAFLSNQAVIDLHPWTSRLPDYPQELTRDLAHVRLLAERIGTWLAGARQAREVAVECKDDDTMDLLTQQIQAFEKHAWFLHATRET